MPTDRIKLLNCDEATLSLILEDNEALARGLNLQVPEPWTEFGLGPFQYALDLLRKQPDLQLWLTYLPILKTSNTLIGSGGYKGAPDQAGLVEIGYEVAEAYRNQGYATEMAQLLIRRAFLLEEVQGVQAHTLAEENASVAVLRKCGFQFVKTIEEEEEGNIWQWRLNRPDGQ